MGTKKVYTNLVNFLEANKQKKVSDILNDVLEMTQAKVQSSVTYKDKEGKVVAIHCYYYKRWMPIVGDKKVEFGAKASTSTGLNTMCKLGVSLWTKQNSLAKKQTSELLAKLQDGSINVSQIADEKAKIEKARTKIEQTDLGFKTEQELIAYLKQNKVSL